MSIDTENRPSMTEFVIFLIIPCIVIFAFISLRHHEINGEISLNSYITVSEMIKEFPELKTGLMNDRKITEKEYSKILKEFQRYKIEQIQNQLQ